MVKLADTLNITLSNTIQARSQDKTLDLIEIPTIGDGNCALHAITLGFIEHLLILKHNKKCFDLNKKATNELIQAIIDSINILQERQRLYARQLSLLEGNAYTDLAEPLQRFIDFITQKPKPTLEDFVAYVQYYANSRQEIAALHVALAPGFRAIGVKQYLAQLSDRGIDDEELLDDAHLLAHDGQSAGHEVLHAIGELFEANIVIFDKTTQQFVLPPEDNQANLTVYIHHVPGHFNYLTPALENNGLKSVLTDKPTKNCSIVKENANHPLKDEMDTLLLWEDETAKRLSTLRTVHIKNELSEIVTVAETVSNNLLAMEEKNVSSTDIKKAVANSNKLLTNVKNKLDITKDKVSSFVRDDLTKQLLLNNLNKPSSYVDPDEALARYLQNAEILSFLNENIGFFKKPSKNKKTIEPKKQTVTHQF